MSGSIDFAEFLKVIENQKDRAENFDDENAQNRHRVSFFFFDALAFSLSHARARERSEVLSASQGPRRLCLSVSLYICLCR